MTMNRVQAGLSMPESFERYGTGAKCRAALEAARWPIRFVCPNCGGAARTRFEHGGLRYWQCGACAQECSLISATIFESTELPRSRWFLAMQLLTESRSNVSALELMRQFEVSYRTAWLLKHKITEAMRVREQHRELDGRVEMDHAYLGGECSGGKLGPWVGGQGCLRGGGNDHGAGPADRSLLRQQPHSDQEVAIFAARHLAPSGTVVSDGLWCFRATTIVGAEHERIVTGGGRASVKLPQLKAINTLLGNLKTAISGTYHVFAFAKYAHRYLAEFIPVQSPFQHALHPQPATCRSRARPGLL